MGVSDGHAFTRNAQLPVSSQVMGAMVINQCLIFSCNEQAIACFRCYTKMDYSLKGPRDFGKYAALCYRLAHLRQIKSVISPRLTTRVDELVDWCAGW